MHTDGKKYVIGIPKIGEAMLRNQLGDIGNNRKESKKKNKPSSLL